MVYILLAPGFEEMEALVPADLLRRAGLEVALTTVGPALVPGTAFDFGFYLVKTLAGAAREQEVRHGTYYR